LWDLLRTGSVDVVASDHSPAPPSMKTGDNFFAIWGGIAGVQCTLPVLMSGGGLDSAQIARLTAGFPAQRFQLPNKGEIQAGNDADFVLVDMAASATLSVEHLHQRHKQMAYLGADFRGVVRQTILRGKTIFHDGVIAEGSHGRFIKPNTYATSRTHT